MIPHYSAYRSQAQSPASAPDLEVDPAHFTCTTLRMYILDQTCPSQLRTCCTAYQPAAERNAALHVP